MSPLLKVLLWLALPVAVCVWAVAHGQTPPLKASDIWGDGHLGKGAVVIGNSWSNSIPVYTRSPARPNVPGAVLTEDVRKICRRGYAASVRPPEGVTDTYKVRLLRRLPTDVPHYLRDYELDDRVPLELGGKPGPNNWWLQPIDEAHAKDIEENRIHREVCDGRIDIHDAQRYFLNWPDGTLQ